jgi:nucleotide-binding universal stress UspA family protein
MRVVIALDDSEQARAVLDTLNPWLSRTDADVHLLSVVDLSEVQATMRAGQPGPEPVATLGGSSPPVQPPFPQAQETHGQALTRARVEREEELLLLVESALKGIRTQIHVVSDADTAGAIAGFGVEIGADLVAVGTHGRSGLTRALLGSVAEAVVRRSKRPVIVVRSGMDTNELVGPTA